MIKNKKVYDLLNDQFQNPFNHFTPTIEDPFILLEEEVVNIDNRLHSNLMVNFLLFSMKLDFTPNVIWRRKDNFIEIVMQSDLSEAQIIVSEAEKKKFIINYIPAIVLKFNLFSIDSFNPNIPIINTIKNPDKDLMVDLANFEIIDVYDKLDFKTFSTKETNTFRKTIKKHELQFKHLFFNPKTYPKFIEKEGKIDIKFPEKGIFNWKIFNEKEESSNETIPNKPSII